MDRHTGEQAPLWLKQVRAQAASLKQQAHKASLEREARFRKIDERRIELERMRIEEQKLREKQLIRGIGLGLLIIAVALTLLTILLQI